MKINIKKWFSWIWTWAQKKAPSVPIAPLVKPATQVIWEGYECLDFLKHGYEQENQYRADSIASAVSNGFTTMIIRLVANMIGALKIECLHWESDKDRKKFCHSWTDKAMEAGIKRWVIIVPKTLTDWAYVEDCFKAYKPQTVQYLIDGGITEAIMKALGVDANGVKITQERFRA